MELSTKGRYAVMALIDLASNGGEHGSVSLADIASRQSISLSYLEQLFARLRRRGIVVAKRGPNGGYRLAKPASVIDVASVVFAVDETVKFTACDSEKEGGCGGRKARCVAHGLWVAMTTHIQDFMASVTLEDILQNKFETTSLGEKAA